MVTHCTGDQTNPFWPALAHVAKDGRVHPLASPAALRQALFLRFYGHEFDADTREKILLAVDGDGGQKGDTRSADE